MKKVYNLHDFETGEVLGSVLLMEATQTSEGELWEGWEDYNKLQEHEHDHCNVNDFVEWFNSEFITQIESIDVDFIQLCR